MKRGLFIVLEGPDGSGKSSLAHLMAEYLQEKGHKIEFSREPGGTKIGEKIRDIILDVGNEEMGNEAEALLYAASRAQHVTEKIRPTIESGKDLICERFYYSSLVYQGIGRKLGVDVVKHFNEFAIQGVYPDLVIFLDIDPEKALLRKEDSGELDRLEIEDVKFHQEVYKGYKEIIEILPEISVVNADRKKEDIYDDVKVLINNILER
ncbi:MAG: dTMP kinase [Bacillota bacterium]|nr:dTMP kinase [Bacillota bacterium]